MLVGALCKGQLAATKTPYARKFWFRQLAQEHTFRGNIFFQKNITEKRLQTHTVIGFPTKYSKLPKSEKRYHLVSFSEDW